MPKVIKTSQGKRCMSARGKFLPNSKCGIGSKSRSKHLRASLGAVVLCTKNKKGVGSCVKVKGESKKHVLKNGGKIWAVNEKAPSRVSAGKKLKSGSAKQQNRISRASKACARKKGGNYRCCVSKMASKTGKGSAKACGGSLSGVTRRRKTAKRRTTRRRAR